MKHNPAIAAMYLYADFIKFDINESDKYGVFQLAHRFRFVKDLPTLALKNFNAVPDGGS
jgi:hypothetical protein